MTYRVPNPGMCGGWKPVNLISDRAKRYRANHETCRPKGPKVCAYCGSKRNVAVGHIDGNEDNGRPSNLAWTCKSCNAAIAVEQKRAGVGKRVRQNNPKHVPSFAEYVDAVAHHTRGRADAGGKVIHATPKSVRSDYALEIWDLRRQHGTATHGPMNKAQKKRLDREIPF